MMYQLAAEAALVTRQHRQYFRRDQQILLLVLPSNPVTSSTHKPSPSPASPPGIVYSSLYEQNGLFLNILRDNKALTILVPSAA